MILWFHFLILDILLFIRKFTKGRALSDLWIAKQYQSNLIHTFLMRYFKPMNKMRFSWDSSIILAVPIYCFFNK